MQARKKTILFQALAIALFFSTEAKAVDSTSALTSFAVPAASSSYVLATGIAPGSGSGTSGNGSVSMFTIGPPQCASWARPVVSISVIGTYANVSGLAGITGIFVYPLNPKGCISWNTHKHPICDGYHGTYSGIFVNPTTNGGYSVYYRNEVVGTGSAWVDGVIDISWTIYCLNPTDLASYFNGESGGPVF